jgi:hypothetical protein
MASRTEAALGSPLPRRLLNAMVARSIWSGALKQELFLQLVFRLPDSFLQKMRGGSLVRFDGRWRFAAPFVREMTCPVFL